MSTVTNTNVACCTIPPVTHEYTPKGSFKPVGAFKKVYVTGPADTEKALVCVYDIFGYFPQTQQGADILASSLCAKVYMPDFFEPDGAYPAEDYPPTSDEQKAKFQKFFGGTANQDVAITKLKAFGEVLIAEGVKRLGLYGVCWGGKVCFAGGAEDMPFDAVSVIHPVMLSVDDANKLVVPLALYASKDEPLDEFTKIAEVLSKNSYADMNDSKYYSNMHHGWSAARANLKDEENKKEYEDVYTKLVKFFTKALD